MPLRNVICSVLIGAMASVALASDRPAKQSPAELLPFATYKEKCDYVILRERTAHISKAEHAEDGTPRIVIDPTLDAPKQWFHRMFLIAHECAHHRMEHTTQEGIAIRLTRRNGVRDHELSADCWAAEELTRNGYVSQLLDLSDQFWRRGFVSPGQGYPSGIQRSNVIRHCAKIALNNLETAYKAGVSGHYPPDHHP